MGMGQRKEIKKKRTLSCLNRNLNPNVFNKK